MLPHCGRESQQQFDYVLSKNPKVHLFRYVFKNNCKKSGLTIDVDLCLWRIMDSVSCANGYKSISCNFIDLIYNKD
jgi:hypothetical protein